MFAGIFFDTFLKVCCCHRILSVDCQLFLFNIFESGYWVLTKTHGND